ncbi:hypothetical protein EVAR_84715_1 [Eumeta japonica]|uniref:Uncharacterized protein n=1 Tax=Eumeta variegata TaxID=151549 RepID=A0A4C1VSM8_EUMVA|nr:hypothetical protein EVAR_84715_1 [Eumeta japonica]
MAQNLKAGEEKEGPGSDVPAHWIIRRQFRAAVSCVVFVHRLRVVSVLGHSMAQLPAKQTDHPEKVASYLRLQVAQDRTSWIFSGRLMHNGGWAKKTGSLKW